MKTTLIIKLITMLIISGLSAWACGETWGENYPLSFFFSMMSVGAWVIAFVGIIISNQK